MQHGELDPVRREQRGREEAPQREHMHEGERDRHEVDGGVREGVEQRWDARDAPPAAIESGSAAGEPLLEETHPPAQPQCEHASDGLAEGRLEARCLGRAHRRAPLEYVAGDVGGKQRQAHRRNSCTRRGPNV